MWLLRGRHTLCELDVKARGAEGKSVGIVCQQSAKRAIVCHVMP